MERSYVSGYSSDSSIQRRTKSVARQLALGQNTTLPGTPIGDIFNSQDVT